MIEGQVTPRSAILAAEFVPQEKIEAREGHALLGFDIVLQHHDRRYSYRRPLRSHHRVILGNDGHAVEDGRLDRFLPGPERERIVGQGPEVGIQHQSGEMFQRGWLANETRPEFVVVNPVQHGRLRPRPVGLPRHRGGSTRPSCPQLYLACFRWQDPLIAVVSYRGKVTGE